MRLTRQAPGQGSNRLSALINASTTRNVFDQDARCCRNRRSSAAKWPFQVFRDVLILVDVNASRLDVAVLVRRQFLHAVVLLAPPAGCRCCCRDCRISEIRDLVEVGESNMSAAAVMNPPPECPYMRRRTAQIDPRVSLPELLDGGLLVRQSVIAQIAITRSCAYHFDRCGLPPTGCRLLDHDEARYSRARQVLLACGLNVFVTLSVCGPG